MLAGQERTGGDESAWNMVSGFIIVNISYLYEYHYDISGGTSDSVWHIICYL